jgi:hypothetical protein
MRTAGIWALSIVGGGIALGAMLGSAADPRPKNPEPQWWQLAGNEAIATSDPEYFGPPPEVPELDVHGGYRPDFDYDAEVWALPIPSGDFYYRFEELPQVSYMDAPAVPYAEAEDAASAAQAAAKETVEADGAVAAPVEVRKSELAANGIY